MSVWTQLLKRVVSSKIEKIQKKKIKTDKIVGRDRKDQFALNNQDSLIPTNVAANNAKQKSTNVANPLFQESDI